jgi:hypothetical protein
MHQISSRPLAEIQHLKVDEAANFALLDNIALPANQEAGKLPPVSTPHL